jgi:hypothetical protein
MTYGIQVIDPFKGFVEIVKKSHNLKVVKVQFAKRLSTQPRIYG